MTTTESPPQEPPPEPPPEAAGTTCLSVNQTIAKVMSEIGAVAKTRRNITQNYNFRGIDEFLNAAHPVLVKYGLTIVPRDMDHQLHVRERIADSGKPGVTIHVILTVRWEIEGPQGDKKYVTTVGEAADTADKATNKAMSAAEKYMLISVFKIPTADIAEGDEGHPDMGSTGTTKTTNTTSGGDPPVDPNKPTKPMMDKMAILCNEVIGKGKTKEIKAVLMAITGRVDSRAQMTKKEASHVIDELLKLQTGAKVWVMANDGVSAIIYKAGEEPFEPPAPTDAPPPDPPAAEGGADAQ